MFRTTPTGLLIPSRMNEEPTHRCNYPDCGWVGYSDREQVTHVMQHVNADQAEIVEATTPYLDKAIGDGHDPEHQEYLERRFRQLRAAGMPLKEALDPKRY